MIAISYVENRPLLASKQVLDQVFEKYRERAQAEEKQKFEELLAAKTLHLRQELEVANE